MKISTDDAMMFFDACETGKGWEECERYCAPDASFSAQSEALTGINTLAEYTDWMKGMCTIMPDAGYELKSFASDNERGNITIYGVFSGTHTGEGGPVPATGKHVKSDYVYVIESQDEKITHVTKIWHSWWAMKELGWA